MWSGHGRTNRTGSYGPAIPGLPGKPGIPGLRRAILGLRKFPVCAEHIYNIVMSVDQDDGSQTKVSYVAKEFHHGEECFERLKNACVHLQKPEMKHPNIVGFIGVWYRPGVELPLIVFEKMDSSLADYLQTSTEVFVRMSLLRDVA